MRIDEEQQKVLEVFQHKNLPYMFSSLTDLMVAMLTELGVADEEIAERFRDVADAIEGRGHGMDNITLH